MKNISQKSWFSLSINIDNDDNLDFIYSQLYNYMVGSNVNNNKLIFYFENDKKNIINEILASDLTDYSFVIEDIKYQNWHTTYEKYFQPIHINDSLMVVPHWYKLNDSNSMDYIRIIPGMAFGTGHHETTQLIIKSLLKYINHNDRVLDLGSGSGILSIVALKFGASQIHAIEYDQDCKDNFYENMELNNIYTNYQLSIEDVILHKDYNYDLVIANINKNVIVDLLPNIKKFQKKKFKIILSGLLISDREDVMEIISKSGFNCIEQTEMGEWVCIVLD